MNRAAADATLGQPVRPDWLTDHAWPFPLRQLVHDGQTLAYTDTGTGPTLLFVHVGMWSILWRDVIGSLSHRYRCVTLDAPGNGLSTSRPGPLSFEPSADAVDLLVTTLDLTDITLVVHDLGGIAAFEAASRWRPRVAGIVAVNTFGWRPSGPLFRGMLALMGNPVVRKLDAVTGWLPRAASTRLGVGRHWDRDIRKIFRRGMGGAQRRNFHRYMAAARRHDYTTVESTLTHLADRPLLTIFGQRNDPLRFQPKWRQRFPDATQIIIPNGLHFPMCDAPDIVAAAITSWHTKHLLLPEA